MGGRIWKPPVGTEVWFVTEHFWRRPGATAWQPEYEFMVFKGTVRSYYTINWTDVCIQYREFENGPIELIEIRLSADKQKIFDNSRDAALLAREMTEDYLRHWGWLWTSGLWPDMPPMPRRWEHYLSDENSSEKGEA